MGECCLDLGTPVRKSGWGVHGDKVCDGDFGDPGASPDPSAERLGAFA